MRTVMVCVLGLALLGLASSASAQMPGPMPSPGMMPGSEVRGDIGEMARMCTAMMQQMMSTAGGMMGMMGRGGMMGGMMPGFWWWGFQILVFWGLVLALAVVGIVLLLRPRRDTSEGLSVLQVRLAKGEISPEEFEQRRRLLV